MMLKLKDFTKRVLVKIFFVAFVVLGLISLHRLISRKTIDSIDFASYLREDNLKVNLQETQEQRKSNLYTYCKHKKPLTGHVKYGDGFLYNDQHKVIYCRIPKVACSTWKRVFLIFEGKQNTLFEIHMSKIHTYPYKYLNKIDPFLKECKKNFYYSFMFSRHPFDRLFSAYRNKFLDPKGRYGYIEALSSWMVFDHIKNKNEMNQYLKENHNGNKRFNVTFEQFVRFVLKNPPYYDQHWQPQTDICKVCNFKFDHIGKFETMNTDAKKILGHLGQNQIYEMFGDDSVYTQKTTSMLKKYYGELPRNLIKGIYQFYKDDFEAFNYDPRLYFEIEI